MRALYASALTVAAASMASAGDFPSFGFIDAPSPGYTPATTHANRKAGKTYAPNGKREVARRLRQAERIAAKRVAA